MRLRLFNQPPCADEEGEKGGVVPNCTCSSGHQEHVDVCMVLELLDDSVSFDGRRGSINASVLNRSIIEHDF